MIGFKDIGKGGCGDLGMLVLNINLLFSILIVFEKGSINILNARSNIMYTY